MPQLSLSLTLADLVRLKRKGVAMLDRVELFRPGRHKAGDRVFTADDLADLERNFKALSTGARPRLPVPVGLDDHDPEQPYLHAEGLPAAGHVTALWTEPGPVTCVRIDGLPGPIADAVRHKLYLGCSAEILDRPPPGIPGEGCTLGGLVFLGTKRPAVKGNAPLPPPRYYAEPRRSPRGGVYVFVEARMASTAHKAALASLLAEKFPQVPAELWATLSPQQVQLIAPGADAGDDEPDAPEVTPNADDAAGDVAKMRDELVTAGILTQDEAAALSDDEIKAKYAEWKGTADAGPPPPPGVTNMSEPTRGRQPARPAPAVTLPAEVVRHYGEAIGSIEARLKAQEKAAADAERETARRQRAERQRTVNALFDGWINHQEQGRPAPKITPAEYRSREKPQEPGLYRRLLEADGGTVRTYAESGALSDFDALVKEIEDRPGFARMFAEQIPGRGVGPKDEFADLDQQTTAYAQRRNKALTGGRN
jgi:hypothetical protein